MLSFSVPEWQGNNWVRMSGETCGCFTLSRCSKGWRLVGCWCISLVPAVRAAAGQDQVLPSLFTANGRESWLLGSAGCIELLLNSRAGHPVTARDWTILGHTAP